MMSKTMFAALALTLAPLPALAQDDSKMVDGWMVAKIQPGVCQIVNTFQNSTMMSFIDAAPGKPGMFLLIGGLPEDKIAEDQSYTGTASWDGWKTSTPLTMKASKSDSGWALLTMLDDNFRARTRSARQLAVRLPALGINGNVTMTPATMNALATCISAG